MENKLDEEDVSKLSLLPWINIEAEGFEKHLYLGVKKIYKKNSPIIDQGEKVENIFYLKKGKVKVLLLTKHGEEKLFWYTSEGTIIGDVPYFHSFPSNAAIISEESCEVYMFSKRVFSEILHANPEFAEYMLEIMARKIRVLVNQIQDISFNNPTIRICKLLYLLSQQYGKKSDNGTELILTITHKEIGSITSIHRVTVTNVLNNLKKQGILEKTKTGYIILDVKKLYAYAFEQ